MTPLVLLGDLAPVGLAHVDIAPDEAALGGLVLGNLEAPLCPATLPPLAKAGPVLRADPVVLADVVRAFPHLAVTLANNHSMDFGGSGLAATLATCRDVNVTCFGAGSSLAAATEAVRLSIAERKLVLLGACERQFGLAESDRPGVAHVSPQLFSQVAALKPTADVLIVSLHGASEMSPWPSPRWQQTARALIEAGADLVHGHHAHVPQGYERHRSGWIVYGPGNTLVNPLLWPEGGATHTSWRFIFDLDDVAAAPRVSTWHLTSTSATSARLDRVTEDAERARACNAPLPDPRLLEGLWQENALLLWHTFYRAGLKANLPQPHVLTRALRTSRRFARRMLRGVQEPCAPKEAERFLYHLFACEHHAEAIATALALEAGSIADRRTAETAALAARWLPGWAAHFSRRT
jgi:poly-gamma-glutamate synthesis protein (capsule biosynthesis protein)